MISLRKTVLGALGALGILAGGTSAQAAPYTELFLSIDESGSIGSTNFYQQMTDYAAVLNSGIIPLDGSLALGVGLFDSGNQLLHAMTQINSQADLDAVIASITGYAGYDGGGTNIAGAIDAGAASLNGFSFGTGLDCASADVNCIIDVSTTAATMQAMQLSRLLRSATSLTLSLTAWVSAVVLIAAGSPQVASV